METVDLPGFAWCKSVLKIASASILQHDPALLEAGKQTVFICHRGGRLINDGQTSPQRNNEDRNPPWQLMLQKMRA